MKVLYDQSADVLYISFVDTTRPVTSVETEKGDLLRVDKEDGTIVGLTVLFFEERTASGGIDFPQLGALVPEGLSHIAHPY